MTVSTHVMFCMFLLLLHCRNTYTLDSLWYFLWSSCWTCWELAPSGRINPSSLCCKLAGELKLKGYIQMLFKWDRKSEPFAAFHVRLFHFGKYDSDRITLNYLIDNSSIMEQDHTLQHREMMDWSESFCQETLVNHRVPGSLIPAHTTQRCFPTLETAKIS